MEVNEAIDLLIGRRVKIWSNPTGSSDCTDSGTLESFDHPWIRLRRGRADVICFSVYNVRLVEALEPVETPVPEPKDVLLRPTNTGE